MSQQSSKWPISLKYIIFKIHLVNLKVSNIFQVPVRRSPSPGGWETLFYAIGCTTVNSFRVFRFSSFYLVHLNLFEDDCLTMVAVWPFWNGLPELKWFVHLVIFCLFECWRKQYILFFSEIWAKLAISYEVLTLNLILSTSLWRKIGLYWAFFHFWGIGPF